MQVIWPLKLDCAKARGMMELKNHIVKKRNAEHEPERHSQECFCTQVLTCQAHQKVCHGLRAHSSRHSQRMQRIHTYSVYWHLHMHKNYACKYMHTQTQTNASYTYMVHYFCLVVLYIVSFCFNININLSNLQWKVVGSLTRASYLHSCVLEGSFKFNSI